MFKNYFIIAYRNIIKHKAYSIINIIGLAVGMAACLFILFWIIGEFSYDRYNENFDSIYRVIQIKNYEDQVIESPKVPSPLGPSLVQDFPEIINFTRYGTFVGEVLIKHEDKVFYELNGAYVDKSYFDIFTTHFIQGDKEDIFQDRFTTVITRSMARKYFGDENPIGKTLELENVCELTITAIIDDIPQNSHLRFDFAVPFELYEAWGADLSNWNSWPCYNYLLVDKDISLSQLNNKISNHLHDKIEGNKDTIYLQPLGKIHLYSHFAYDYPAILGDISDVYIFSLIGVFILSIACINFINLSTAGSIKRAGEIGLRKAIGASKKNLVYQFIGETILLSLIAFLFALLIVEVVQPAFIGLTGGEINITFTDKRVIFGAIAIIIFSGILSGIYPALFLSSFKPSKTLKGSIQFGSQKAYLRKTLIVFQFILSTVLIVCTLVVFKQVSFLQNKKLGYNKENVVCIQSRPGMYRDYPKFKENLLKHPGIIQVTATQENGFPIAMQDNYVTWRGKDTTTKHNIFSSFVDFDYFETFEIPIIQGRTFSRQFVSDSLSVVLNTSAVKILGFEEPIGQTITFYGKQYTVIGITEDYHTSSLHNKIPPLLTFINQNFPFSLYIKIQSENIPEQLKIIEKEWHKIVPAFPFVFNFLDQKLNNLYQHETYISRIFTYFAILAIFISCLGLFGLTTFTVESRTKEIGVRKVLGSSAGQVIFLLSKDFSKLVLLANIIAWPIACYAMNKWLQSFAYRTDIGFGVFLLSGVIAMIIAFLTVSFRTFKAAHANPVKSLKYE